MLKFVKLNYTVTYLQTLEEVPWLLRLKKPKKQQKFSKNLKRKFYKKIAKMCDIQKLNNNFMANKIFQLLIIKTLRMFFDPWVWKDLNKEK